MAIFKCKMCGGPLDIQPGQTTATCQYCFTQQTLPRLSNDRRANLYDRANHFRRNNEFDKAMSIYESILSEDSTDAEAYWSLVLCRYGIEYVEDPATRRRIPTVNRAQFTSIFDDGNYRSAISCADAYQRSIYEAEARAINELQKGILAISQQTEPFDVFICYKESDPNGRRTPDSVLANDLYHQLTQEGFKVFFARITLEDKLGTAYEPYIFAALNSAKVMVVLGTRPEYFNAVCVKNEWSRYLSLVKQSGGQKILIPAYKDMDPYDLPDEFSHLQAQDMGKLGFMQDLIRGIKKLIRKDAGQPGRETAANGAGVAPLLKRAFMFLEDGDWASANEYCEKVLDQDPENAEAYLGKLMAELRCRQRGSLRQQPKAFDGSNNYKKALRFADEALKAELTGAIGFIHNTRMEGIYAQAMQTMQSARAEAEYGKAAQLFESISGHRDSGALAAECRRLAEQARLADIYSRAADTMQRANAEQAFLAAAGMFDSIAGYRDSGLLAQQCRSQAATVARDSVLSQAKALAAGELPQCEQAVSMLMTIPGWKDADELLAACRKKVEQLRAQAEADRLEQERQAELARREAARRAKRDRKIAVTVASAITAVGLIVLLVITVIIPTVQYNSAVALMDQGKYAEAIEAFAAMDGYRDSEEQIENCETAMLDEKYDYALSLMEQGKYTEAIAAFRELGGYRDSKEQIQNCDNAILDGIYDQAAALMEEGKYTEAIEVFTSLDGYWDSRPQIQSCEYAILDGKYDQAVALMESGEYEAAIEAFTALGSHRDSIDNIAHCQEMIRQGIYNEAIALESAGDYAGAHALFASLDTYKDSAQKARKYQLYAAKPGDRIVFGTYNSKEITWVVLDQKDGKLLILAENNIRSIQFNTDGRTTSWTSSTLRAWMNDDFYTAAFTGDEKSQIVSSSLSTTYTYESGSVTTLRSTDKVFALSVEEFEQYVSPGKLNLQGGNWWLRTDSNAFRVYDPDIASGLELWGNNADSSSGARPAMWITIK